MKLLILLIAILILILAVFSFIFSSCKLKLLIKEREKNQEIKMKKLGATDTFRGLFVEDKVEIEGEWVVFYWLGHCYLGLETESPYNELVMVEISQGQYDDAVKRKEKS